MKKYLIVAGLLLLVFIVYRVVTKDSYKLKRLDNSEVYDILASNENANIEMRLPDDTPVTQLSRLDYDQYNIIAKKTYQLNKPMVLEVITGSRGDEASTKVFIYDRLADTIFTVYSQNSGNIILKMFEYRNVPFPYYYYMWTDKYAYIKIYHSY